ncbi:MAG: hypothetical protein IT347_01505 [Candidatus Eisenbacteria bacterium]|nr:hypothetical protein [Candidatus Eisenbacteria bacterium]
MNRDVGRFLGPLFAIAVFAFVLWQTLQALQASGVWRFGAPRAVVPVTDPLASLDGLVSRTQALGFDDASRDPFGYGAAQPGPGGDQTVRRRVVTPPPPAQPVLTAIIYDNDPRAIVRWEGRDFTVHTGMLFADFTVVSIAPEQVVLRRGAENLVLRRKPQGD